MSIIAGIGLSVIAGAQAALGDAPLAAPVGDVDFSVWAMFMRATITVKIVMAVLVLASFWSWAIIIEKWVSFGRLRRLSSRFEDGFWSGQPLDDLFDRISDKARAPIERVFVAGMTE